MSSRANVDIVRSNIEVLVKEGLGPRAEADFLLVRDACLVMVKLSGEEKVCEPDSMSNLPLSFVLDSLFLTELPRPAVELLSTRVPFYWHGLT